MVIYANEVESGRSNLSRRTEQRLLMVVTLLFLLSVSVELLFKAFSQNACCFDMLL